MISSVFIYLSSINGRLSNFKEQSQFKLNIMEEIDKDVDGLIEKLTDIMKLKSQDPDDEHKIEVVRILDGVMNATSKETINGNSECKFGELFSKLLMHESNEIVIKTAKAIAEIAKTQSGRLKCTNCDLITALMQLMEKSDVEILTQASRALGNICYENDEGNKLVQKNDGLKHIFNLLKYGVNLGNENGAELLRNVTAGFLLNYLVDQKDLQEEALDKNLIDIACDVLDIDSKSQENNSTHVLLTLEVVNDSGFQFLDERLINVLIAVLTDDRSSELSQICLELLHGQAENEGAKILLAKAGLCELLVDLLEKHVSRCVDEEARSVLRTACNLIVLIITGDESMNYLFDNTNGPVYRKLVKLLEDGWDEDLQVAAVLAMGNFARTDRHCELMVEQGVHKQLLHLLTKNNASDGDIRFQHALLSAVRNLVIPNKNKPIMLNDGLIDVIYPMISIPTFPVVFKLLGTLRIVIDGQEKAASLLGMKEELLGKVIEWCSTDDHPGVQGEANRLLAWLVINSRNRDVVHSLIDKGAIQYLVEMITAPHVLMKNEALISLTIITTIALEKSQAELMKFNIIGAMIEFFGEKALQVRLEIIQNATTFITSMMESGYLKDEIKNSGLRKSLKIFFNSIEPDRLLPNQETQTRALLDILNA